MESNIKISVIVPVYNCEKYVSRCVESLINQTMKDIEIIIIDDGSQDKTVDIVEAYKIKDDRINLITKENSGVSDSRNRGIQLSKGKYIYFVDGDDWIDLNTLEVMYEIAEKNNIDIVMCTYIREFMDHSKKKNINLIENKVYEKEELNILHRRIIGPIGNEFSRPDSLDSIGSVCGKLYKKDLILKSNNKFVDLKEIGTAEDVLFNLVIFKYVKRFMFTERCFFHYWKKNDNSITTKYNFNMFEQWKNLFDYMCKFIESNDLDKTFYEALNNRICIGILGLGLNECKKDNKVSISQKVKNLKNILNDDIIINSYKNFDLKYFPIHWRIFYWFNKKRMASFSYGMLSIIEFLRKRI